MRDSAKKRNLPRAALLLALIKVAGLFVSFLSIILLANIFGAGQKTDIFFIAMVFPVFFLRQIGRTINCSFIPVFSDILTSGDEDGAWRMASSFTFIFLALAAAAGLIYFLAAPYFIYILAPGFSSEAIDTIVRLTRVLTPAFVLLSAFAVSESILNSKWKFIFPSAASNLPGIGMIAGILLLAPSYGIMGVTVGVLVGIALQAVLTIAYLFRKVRTLSFDFDWKDSGVRAALGQFAPQLFSSSINQINQIADKSMATLLGIGRVSALTYSSRLIIFLPEIFLNSFGRMIMPTLSEQVSLEKFDEIKEMLNSAFRWILFFLLPVVCATIILRSHIVGLLFERGSFTADNTRFTAFALAFYAPSILLVTINICIRRTIFALQQSAFIARLGVVGVGFNVLMNFTLMQFLDVGGLALATTLSSLLHLVVSYWFLTTKLGKIHDEMLLGGLAKTCLGCAVMSVVLLLAPGYLAEVMPVDSAGTKLAFLITISASGGLTYLAAGRILRIEELGKLLSMVRRKARGNNGEPN